jgi:hypothetical protein
LWASVPALLMVSKMRSVHDVVSDAVRRKVYPMTAAAARLE